ncbi:MAG: hypothetical protein AB4426_03130 [Xenococcaceae cyanobacterium]
METEKVKETQTALTTQTLHKKMQARQMHKYILVCVGAWLLFIATFPIAYLRVSQSGKYTGTPFKSLTWDDSQKASASYQVE